MSCTARTVARPESSRVMMSGATGGDGPSIANGRSAAVSVAAAGGPDDVLWRASAKPAETDTHAMDKRVTTVRVGTLVQPSQDPSFPDDELPAHFLPAVQRPVAHVCLQGLMISEML